MTTGSIDRQTWQREAVRIIEADFNRSADTHLIPVELPGFPGIDLYLKSADRAGRGPGPTGARAHG